MDMLDTIALAARNGELAVALAAAGYPDEARWCGRWSPRSEGVPCTGSWVRGSSIPAWTGWKHVACLTDAAFDALPDDDGSRGHPTVRYYWSEGAALDALHRALQCLIAQSPALSVAQS